MRMRMAAASICLRRTKVISSLVNLACFCRQTQPKRDRREMSDNRNWTLRSSHFLQFLASFFYLFISGFSDDSSSPKNGTKAETTATSHSNTGSLIVIILIVLAVLVLLSFLLFKLWQKKRREEQYARLLKLFEEDDELEVELGLRD